MARLILQLGQSRAILAFIALIGAVAGYLSYSQSDEGVILPPTEETRGTIESFANFRVDFSILENETYKSLKVFGESPVTPGVTGSRRNPFAPL